MKFIQIDLAQFATVHYAMTLHPCKCDNKCVAPKVTNSVSVTGVISKWEGGAHEGSHVLLHSTAILQLGKAS